MIAGCHGKRRGLRGSIKTGLSTCFRLPSSRSQDRPRLTAARSGSWRATFGPLTCYMWGSGVLQHSARAVVPPPRLRAKWVVFSAHLRTIHSGPGWGSARRCREVKNLRNPAKVGSFRKAHRRAWAAGFSWCLGKRVRFFLSGVCLAGGPYLLGLRPNFDGLGWVRLKVRIL